jgi:hypothetical protein
MRPDPENLVDLPEYRGREEIFVDRRHAGRVLAGMLAAKAFRDGIVLAIPAGGDTIYCANVRSGPRRRLSAMDRCVRTRRH